MSASEFCPAHGEYVVDRFFACPECLLERKATPDPRDAEIAALKRQLADARLQAVRYAFLRVNPKYMGWEHDFRPEEIDREIDREIVVCNAIAARKGATS